MLDGHFFAAELVDFQRALVRTLSKLITSMPLLLSVAIFILCISIYFSFQTGEWHWLQRSMDSPVPRNVQPPELGKVIQIPEVSGLHHHYERVAA